MRLLRALSLDVVAGVACGGLLAEDLAQTRMKPAWWITLLTAVWSVYTVDHLLDAFRPGARPNTARHAFHRRHARGLVMALAVTVTVGFSAAWLAATSAPAPWVFAILSVQIATPGALLLAEPWSRKGERYRGWGDSVFLLGVIPRLLGSG